MNAPKEREKERKKISIVGAALLCAIAAGALASFADSSYFDLKLSKLAKERATARETLDGEATATNANGSDERALTDERANVIVQRIKTDAQASRSAIEVLETFAAEEEQNDDALANALDFLRQLDDAPTVEISLRSFNASSGDPLSSAAIVCEDDLELGAVQRVAKRACEASSRAFFFLAILGTTIAPVGSRFCAFVRSKPWPRAFVARRARAIYAAPLLSASTVLLASVRLRD